MIYVVPMLIMCADWCLQSDAMADSRVQALRSPKVFWNVVHAGAVGAEVGFQDALATLMPETDWKAVFTRKKKLKYDSLEWAQ